MFNKFSIDCKIAEFTHKDRYKLHVHERQDVVVIRLCIQREVEIEMANG